MIGRRFTEMTLNVRSKKIFLATAISFGLIFNSCQAQDQIQDVQQKLNDETLMSILWMQTSTEYRGLCYQAFNTAMIQIDKAIKNHKKKDKPLAIIFDVDETIFDNTTFDANFIGTDDKPNVENLNAWINSAKALPIPGVVNFAQEVNNKGLQIFYVTNRNYSDHLEGTFKNLKKFNFPYVDREHVLMKTDKGSKLERFNQIAKNFEVVVYIGDDVNDFPVDSYGKNFKERNEIFDAHKKDFGTKFILLPNPIYGHWENAIAENYSKMTAQEKDIARRSTLKK